MGNRSWKHKRIDGASVITTAYQAHEDKLYVNRSMDRKHVDTVTDLNKKMQSERPYGGRWGYVFQWPDIITRQMAHAQFPEATDMSLPEEKRMEAYAKMALAYPRWVAQHRVGVI